MRYNILKCVQLILSAMDSDEVNSIGDSTESLQIVDVLETTYNDLVSTLDFPNGWGFFELLPSGDINKPTKMSLPSAVSKLEWIQYDFSETSTVRSFRPLTPMGRVEFFDRMNGLDSATANVYQYDLLVGTGTFDVRGFNDKNPTYYTTADDNTIVFDNYNVAFDNTLVGNKTHCYGMSTPQFQRTDAFIPDFEPRQFSLFFNEAKAQAFLELKQVQNGKAEQRARKGWVQSHRKGAQIPRGQIKQTWTPDFGRKR